MRNTAISRINTMGKIGSIIVLIMKIFVFIGIVGTLIGCIALARLPKDFITITGQGVGSITIDLEAIGVNLTEENRSAIEKEMTMTGGTVAYDMDGTKVVYDEMTIDGNVITLSGSGNVGADRVNVHDLVYVTIAALVSLVCTIVSLFFAGFLCKAFKDCESPFDNEVIKKMQYFAYSLIPWVVIQGITDGLNGIFATGKADISLHVDLSMLWIVIVIWGLTYVFKYGAELQKESDETL